MLAAYRVVDHPGLRLVPAYPNRDWMQATRNHFANRCLPLVMANQWGWFIVNNREVTVSWNGGVEQEAVVIQVDSLNGLSPISSHFGHGIITWHLPWVFRTPPGFNLLIRGPTNWPKDGAIALDGVVETDWSVTTFTMNWQITRKATPICFGKDEPIAMLVPQRRGELEQFGAVERSIHTDPELEKKYFAWASSRAAFLHDLNISNTQANHEEWQRHYMRGRLPDGVAAQEHQTKLALKPFHRDSDRSPPQDNCNYSDRPLVAVRNPLQRLRRMRGTHARTQ